VENSDMRKAVKNLKFPLLIILPLILSRCSMIYFPYFRNYSDRPVELIFELSDYYEAKNYQVKYKMEILPISRKTYMKLDDSLQITMSPDNKASLIIPANSTVLFSRWTGLQSTIIFLKQENRLDSISIFTNERFTHQFKKRHGFPESFVYYYDYK
jgi:hypothetical protein